MAADLGRRPAQLHRRRPHGGRSQDPGQRHQPDLRRSAGQGPSRRPQQAAGDRLAPGPGAGADRGPDQRRQRDPRPGHRLHPAGTRPGTGGTRLRPGRAAQLAIRLRHGRCGPAYGLPHAPGRRGQAGPPAPAVLRSQSSRRPAQPDHERHRQHHHDPAAGVEPAAHLRPHHHRRPGPDDLDQPAAGPGLPGHDPAFDRRHHAGRPAIAEPVRRPVGADRRSQRARRGDPHRAHPGAGLRPPAAGDRGIQPPEPAALRSQLQGPVPVRPDHARHPVPGQPELRDHRRRRRLSGRLGDHVPGRRPGLHPLLPAVHDADHPDREPDQPAPLRPGLLRTGLRVP